jgi:predicted hydrocarbon binding protein
VSTKRELRQRQEDGWILEGEERILSFRVKTFQAMLDRLYSIAESNPGKTLLYQIGQDMGHAAFDYSKKAITPEDHWKILDDILSRRGWGRCVSANRINDERYVTYAYTIRDCPICYNRKATEPMCDIVRGIVTGWQESSIGRKAEASDETRCTATGAKFCIFHVSFKE